VGLEIDRHEFSDAEFARFVERLHENVAALERLLARPGFGVGAATIGADLELNLIDADGRPLPINTTLLAGTTLPGLQLECDRFNVEIATTPQSLAGRPFTALGGELDRVLAALRDRAARHGARLAAIGILPTLREDDLSANALTESPRFRALSAGLRRLRQAPFEVAISGDERLDFTCDDVTLEGATTSWQIHLRVPPADFARTYNACQIATAPVLATAVNSPTFLGRRLWDETRIALFRQAVDDRPDATPDDWRPSRVSFGHGWVRESAIELFGENVAMHAPLVASVGDEDPAAVVAAGGIPVLRELRLHNGTIWRWNRAVYDPGCGGHLRIEMRALPAGPTVVDMLANSAFLLGLTHALTGDADRIVTGLTFGQARRNFYDAARRGLDAELLWPSDPPSPRAVPARRLVASLLPLARQGLVAQGVLADEANRLLDVVAARVESGRTGAAWQRRTLARLVERHARDAALAAMLERYLAHAATGLPVHTWPDVD
jgi:gamma-glutamyl:cysteine ligase YbdK (ATP-grasp superfamily)